RNRQGLAVSVEDMAAASGDLYVVEVLVEGELGHLLVLGDLELRRPQGDRHQHQGQDHTHGSHPAGKALTVVHGPPPLWRRRRRPTPQRCAPATPPIDPTYGPSASGSQVIA